MLYSKLALERGSPQAALIHAKQGVRLLRRAWANMEQLTQQSSADSSQMDPSKLLDDASQLSEATVTLSQEVVNRKELCGCRFWALIAPLFRSISYLSSIYAHHGMFQETMFYAEQAQVLAKQVGSEVHTAMASASLGNMWLKAGCLDKGSEYFVEAKQLSISDENSRDAATLVYHLGIMHGLLGDRDAEVTSYENAETTLQCLTEKNFIDGLESLVDPADELENEMSKLSLSKKKQSAPRKAAVRPNTAAKRKPAARAKSPIAVTSSISEECPPLMSLKATILRQKAVAFISLKRCGEALGILQETSSYSTNQMDAVSHGLAMAKQLLVSSVEQMAADPVYSVLQESTISFPSVVGLLKNSGERLSTAKLSPPPKRSQAAKGGREVARSKSPAPDSFFDKLRRAQEQLTEVHTVALLIAPVSVLHTISALLNSVAILLSAAGQMNGKLLAHPGFASCSIGMFTDISISIHVLTIQKLQEL